MTAGRYENLSALMALLDLELDQVGPQRVTGSVAADERHHQPFGIVHGGLYATVVETFASIGGIEAARKDGKGAVGVTNITNFLRPHESGRLDVTATAIQQGRSQQLWLVDIHRQSDGKLVAHGQLRLQNVDT